MKNLLPLLLSAILLSSTAGCSKTNSQTDNTSSNNKTALPEGTSSQPNNQQISVPAGTSFETVLQ